MADLEQLKSALIKADAAGDSAGAKVLADAIRTAQPAPAAAEPPSYPAVIGNALNKGLAAIPDFAFDLGPNLWNMGARATGNPQAQVPVPSYAKQGMEKLNFIRPEAEPQTEGQRITDRAVQAGVGLAFTPAKSLAQAAGNAGIGLLSGGAAGVTKEVTGSEPLATAVGMASPIGAQAAGNMGRQKVAEEMARKSSNEVRDATLEAAQKEGYKVQPSSVNDSFLNNRLESIAGKAAVKQDLSIRNQEITNQLANRAIGLPEGTALTPEKLSNLRKSTAEPYREVAAIEELPGYGVSNKSPKQLLADLKDARFNAKALYKKFDDPKALREAAAETEKAARIEALLERIAEKQGRPGLVDDLREARTTIAKTHDIEKGLNVGDANVDARAIGRAADKKPLTGELETIGKFAQGPGRQVTREAASVPSPSVSGTDAGMTAMLGTLGYGAGGAPGLLAGGLPLIRGPVRSMVNSDAYQRFFAKPNYGNGKYLSQIPEGNAALQAALMAAIQARQQGKE